MTRDQIIFGALWLITLLMLPGFARDEMRQARVVSLLRR